MMKNILAILLLSAFLSAEQLHTLKAGQVISADQLNENFNTLKNYNKLLTSEDLIGEYTCRIYNTSSTLNYQSSNVVTGPEALYYYFDQDVAFLDDQDGTYSAQFPAAFIETYHQPGLVPCMFTLENNILYLKEISQYAQPQYYSNVVKQSDGSFKFYNYNNASTNVSVMKCTSKSVLPSPANDLTSSVLATDVTLQWNDNSTNESGFKILRKDALSSSYVVITTLNTNTTSYTETLPSGEYWYRVVATNAAGDSLGTNVVKVNID